MLQWQLVLVHSARLWSPYVKPRKRLSGEGRLVISLKAAMAVHWILVWGKHRNFSELHERKLKETTLDVFTLFLHPVQFVLASQSNSIRGFEDIEMRLTQLFNAKQRWQDDGISMIFCKQSKLMIMVGLSALDEQASKNTLERQEPLAQPTGTLVTCASINLLSINLSETQQFKLIF